MVSPDDRYFEPEVELLGRSELRDVQEQRLLELVPRAYELAPLYREVWDKAGVHPRHINSMADFKRLAPFINKDMIREFRDRHQDPYGGLLMVDPADLQSVMSSSGTTGDATLFPESSPRWGHLQTGWIRDLWENGLRPGDRAICGTATTRGTGYHDMRQLGVTTLSINAWFGQWEKVLDAIEKYQVNYVQLTGPVIPELDRLARTRDMRKAFASVKFAGFAGEPLGTRMRAKIKNEWGLELAMGTSAGDTGMAWECREKAGYHLWEDTVIPENLDPDSLEPASASAGELVVTDIDNQVAPLIRYRTDDLVKLDESACACGRVHARMHPLGRVGDLTLVRGIAIGPMQIWEILEGHEETSSAVFQLIRPKRELDELRIRVGYAPERTSSVSDLDQRLTDEIYRAVGVHPVLDLVPEQEVLSRAASAAKIPRVAKE